MPTICPQEAKRIADAAFLHAQVPISIIAKAMIYAVKCRLESGDPSDSLSSLSCKEEDQSFKSSVDTFKASIRATWADKSKDYII